MSEEKVLNHTSEGLLDRIRMQKLDIRLTHEVDLQIDQFTACLEHSESGEIYQTDVTPVTIADIKEVSPKHGWNDFDWNVYYSLSSCRLMKLTIRNDNQIQGIIAYEPKDGWIDIHLVESAPWNIQSKTFLGVGPHLFAIACKDSFELDFEGFVTFIAKTKLVDHYVKTLNAKVLNPKTRQMVIETEPAKQLVSTYF